jgi:hypothetical protein
LPIGGADIGRPAIGGPDIGRTGGADIGRIGGADMGRMGGADMGRTGGADMGGGAIIGGTMPPLPSIGPAICATGVSGRDGIGGPGTGERRIST